MYSFQNTILVCCYCTAFPHPVTLIMVLIALQEKADGR